MIYRKNDTVSVAINTYPTSRRLGDFEGTVVTGGEHELVIRPTDWDEACDLLQREGSMTWTEIRDAREYGSLDAVPEEDVTLVMAAGVPKEEIRAAVCGFIETMFVSLTETFEMESGDVDPLLNVEINSATDQLAELAYTWYVANA
jgi:hypothetical protein